MRPLFEANVVDAAANIFRMPKEAFEYYLMAFARYVVSIDASSSDGASDAASCLLNYVLLTLQQEAEKLKNISHDLLPIIETIAASQERYDAPPNIYGSFVEKRDEIFRLTDGLLKSAT